MGYLYCHLEAYEKYWSGRLGSEVVTIDWRESTWGGSSRMCYTKSTARSSVRCTNKMYLPSPVRRLH